MMTWKEPARGHNELKLGSPRLDYIVQCVFNVFTFVVRGAVMRLRPLTSYVTQESEPPRMELEKKSR